ncbi:MAG TPA: reverse transcriptase domain-containing protein [Acidimicrobiia bacterium]|nr:reverse transcriptase domain-containing protein [Acidimicrobiia bacterium]
MRTSECGDAASKRIPSRSPLDGLAADEPWVDAVEAFRARNPRRRDRIADYERILAGGAHRRIGEAVLAGRYRPAPPAESWLNKADGRKKRLFLYPPADELLFRVVNRLMQPAAVEAASPWCTSFLPGGGARASFRRVLTDPHAETKAALRLDLRDYFNSIDVRHLLAGLPASFTTGPMGALLRASLLDARVVRRGCIIDGGRKGVMAGTPLAPMLATLYLRDLDREIGDTGLTYARYSDDFLVLAPPADVPGLDALVRARLCERGLEVNEQKSTAVAPGLPWDFLGFRYAERRVALAPVTERKLAAKTTRLARRLLRRREQAALPIDDTVRAFSRRTNRRLYGVPAERADFSWATWFLPLLDDACGLERLDGHVQREARYAATGRRRPRVHALVPYTVLRDAGYLPLVAAFWAAKEGPASYDALVARRTGLP